MRKTQGCSCGGCDETARAAPGATIPFLRASNVGAPAVRAALPDDCRGHRDDCLLRYCHGPDIAAAALAHGAEQDSGLDPGPQCLHGAFGHYARRSILAAHRFSSLLL